MKRILVAASILACCVSFEALATANLPMVCNSAAVAGVCPGDSWTTALGAPGKYVAVSGKGVIDWKDALATDLLRVCPSDIAAGAVCPVARVNLSKALAATAVVDPLRKVTFTWGAPTVDVSGAPLPAGDITGYSLSWNYAIGGDVNNIPLSPTLLTYSTQVQSKRICARVTVLGKGGENVTPELCKDPPTTAQIPAPPTNFSFSF